jgi:hypothetical protein
MTKNLLAKVEIQKSIKYDLLARIKFSHPVYSGSISGEVQI